MNKDTRIQELKRLQIQLDQLRAELDYSPAGVIWLADYGKSIVVVEADGFGGATTSVIEGNYPLDYFARCEKRFQTEREATTAARKIAAGKVSASRVLGA